MSQKTYLGLDDFVLSWIGAFVAVAFSTMLPRMLRKSIRLRGFGKSCWSLYHTYLELLESTPLSFGSCVDASLRRVRAQIGIQDAISAG
ncbi:hypothetical protein SH449x_000816 [Pirellulaceae bacterium SH449]